MTAEPTRVATEPVTPSVGWAVLHLFCHVGASTDPEGAVRAVKAARSAGDQVVSAALLGHKADVCVMALGPDLWRLRALQSALRTAGLEAESSYVSLTELSEYADGLPNEMKRARLYPKLPPEGKPAFCFYPMSKRRSGEDNWYMLGFEERKRLMLGHGAVGRNFRGRVLQLITGSTGLDDFEWGVTLFGVHPDDLKECVYQMRFDEASARFAEFGPFWTGAVAEIEDVLERASSRLEDGAVVDRTGVIGTESKLARLQSEITAIGRVVVAFSGGADSALVARVSTEVLGADNALCATAVSPSLAPAELEDCRALVSEWGLRWLAVQTDEMADDAYAQNAADRCYHCKKNLMDALGPLAASEGASIVLGVNLDDLGDHRPGQSAAAERGARFPLVDSGFTKSDVREVSRLLGLRTWDKPAAACLASRVPYGTRVTMGVLTKVADAESALRELGFRQFRVRHYGDVARVELEEPDMAVALARRHEMVAAVKGAGYRYVTLDLEGFRSGNLNGALL